MTIPRNLSNLAPGASTSGILDVPHGGTGTTTSTGTGNVVLSNSPVLVTPNLGTPSALNLASATGLPLTTGITGTLAAGNGGTGLSSPGTSGNVLTSNGSGWVSSPPAGGGGAFSLVGTQTAPASSIFEFTGLTEDAYTLTFQGLRPTRTLTTMFLQFGTGSTPTYYTSGYYYIYTSSVNIVYQTTAVANNAFLQLGPQPGAPSANDFGLIGQIQLTGLVTGVPSFSSAMFSFSGQPDSGITVGGCSAGSGSPVPITAIKIYADTFYGSNPLKSGSVSLYAISN